MPHGLSRTRNAALQQAGGARQSTASTSDEAKKALANTKEQESLLPSQGTDFTGIQVPVRQSGRMPKFQRRSRVTFSISKSPITTTGSLKKLIDAMKEYNASPDETVKLQTMATRWLKWQSNHPKEVKNYDGIEIGRKIFEEVIAKKDFDDSLQDLYLGLKTVVRHLEDKKTRLDKRKDKGKIKKLNSQIKRLVNGLLETKTKEFQNDVLELQNLLGINDADLLVFLDEHFQDAFEFFQARLAESLGSINIYNKDKSIRLSAQELAFQYIYDRLHPDRVKFDLQRPFFDAMDNGDKEALLKAFDEDRCIDSTALDQDNVQKKFVNPLCEGLTGTADKPVRVIGVGGGGDCTAAQVIASVVSGSGCKAEAFNCIDPDNSKISQASPLTIHQAYLIKYHIENCCSVHELNDCLVKIDDPLAFYFGPKPEGKLGELYDRVHENTETILEPKPKLYTEVLARRLAGFDEETSGIIKKSADAAVMARKLDAISGMEDDELRQTSLSEIVGELAEKGIELPGGTEPSTIQEGIKQLETQEMEAYKILIQKRYGLDDVDVDEFEDAEAFNEMIEHAKLRFDTLEEEKKTLQEEQRNNKDLKNDKKSILADYEALESCMASLKAFSECKNLADFKDKCGQEGGQLLKKEFSAARHVRKLLEAEQKAQALETFLGIKPSSEIDYRKAGKLLLLEHVFKDLHVLEGINGYPSVHKEALMGWINFYAGSKLRSPKDIVEEVAKNPAAYQNAVLVEFGGDSLNEENLLENYTKGTKNRDVNNVLQYEIAALFSTQPSRMLVLSPGADDVLTPQQVDRLVKNREGQRFDGFEDALGGHLDPIHEYNGIYANPSSTPTRFSGSHGVDSTKQLDWVPHYLWKRVKDEGEPVYVFARRRYQEDPKSDFGNPSFKKEDRQAVYMFELKPRFEYVPVLCEALKTCGRTQEAISADIEVLLEKLEGAIKADDERGDVSKRGVYEEALTAIQAYISEPGNQEAGIKTGLTEKVAAAKAAAAAAEAVA